MLPPGGGQNNVDPRFLSLFNIFTLIFPSQQNQEHIYNSILKGHLHNWENQEIIDMIPKIGAGTLNLCA